MTACSEWAKRWFAKAESDLLCVRLVLDARQGAYDTACFHCQQCVEKYLKGFLAIHGVEIPRTHHLETLLQLLASIEPSFSQLAILCDVLTGYAVESRYPDDMYEYQWEDAA